MINLICKKLFRYGLLPSRYRYPCRNFPVGQWVPVDLQLRVTSFFSSSFKDFQPNFKKYLDDKGVVCRTKERDERGRQVFAYFWDIEDYEIFKEACEIERIVAPAALQEKLKELDIPYVFSSYSFAFFDRFSWGYYRVFNKAYLMEILLGFSWRKCDLHLIEVKITPPTQDSEWIMRQKLGA